MRVPSLKMEEVAEAASAARAAPATNKSNKWPAALSSAGAGAMSATSLLFAWLAAGTLRRCGAMDEEEVFSGVLWGLSPLICAYLLCWTVALSPRAKGAAGVVSAVAKWLLVLAAAADKLNAPIAGAAAIILAPLLSACACGRALAERRQRAGTERWSAATAASTPIYQSRAEEREQRESKVVAVSMMVLMAVVVAAIAWLASWTSPSQKKWEVTPEAVFFFAGPLLVAVRLMLPCMVGSPVLNNMGDMLLAAALIGVIIWLVVVASAGAHYGMIAGSVVFWMGELCMLGFLGYFLAVEAHYEHLMAIERRKPRRAKDASGLLDGRDNVDACSAHIDAAAGICVDCVLPRRCKCSCRSQIKS